ncbi:MAG TPA: DegT/DnrJ/EryC1/StrS family aminotransferase [Nakamurella sp.]|nr:DegT/DnrJ/EryC1/StrS family aminotransferase [Nakamurella sp.]
MTDTADLTRAIADAPLVRAWSSFLASGATPFTIPGHKRQAGTVSDLLARMLDADVPLFGGLDAVKLTSGVLTRAERLAGQAWGARWCRFSTGGSTHANQAIVLAAGQPGRPVLVSRTAHRSTLLALVLAGLRPVWLPVDCDPVTAIPLGLNPDRLRVAAKEHPDAAAVLCVEPGYFGTVSAVAELADAAHRAGLPLIVDQAWGAHFGFHPGLPPHALRAGADAMVISVHKSLPAFSQASALFVASEWWDEGRLERAFEAGNTTSPAGAILASVDAARALLTHPAGTALLDRLIGLVADARGRLRAAGIGTVDPASFPPGRYDPAKLVIRTGSLHRNGNDVEAELVRAGVPVEMADADTVIPLVSLLDDERTVGRLVEAMLDAVRRAPAVRRSGDPGALTSMLASWPVPEQLLTPREAFFAEVAAVPADRAAGRICAEVIAPYPPGIPALVPGELIDADRLRVLRDAAAAGTRIAYAADPSLHTIQVVDDPTPR